MATTFQTNQKFRVGDWVVYSNSVVQIISYNDGFYKITSNLHSVVHESLLRIATKSEIIEKFNVGQMVVRTNIDSTSGIPPGTSGRIIRVENNETVYVLWASTLSSDPYSYYDFRRIQLPGNIIIGRVLGETTNSTPKEDKITPTQYDWVTVDDPSWIHGVVQLLELPSLGGNYVGVNLNGGSVVWAGLSHYAYVMRYATAYEINKVFETHRHVIRSLYNNNPSVVPSLTKGIIFSHSTNSLRVKWENHSLGDEIKVYSFPYRELRVDFNPNINTTNNLNNLNEKQNEAIKIRKIVPNIVRGEGTKSSVIRSKVQEIGIGWFDLKNRGEIRA